LILKPYPGRVKDDLGASVAPQIFSPAFRFLSTTTALSTRDVSNPAFGIRSQSCAAAGRT
jgi:hypothetical protein